MTLLIHSMSEFADLAVKVLEVAGARDLVEIGAEFGGMSAVLADHARRHCGHLTSIDPAPKPGFADWAGANGVTHLASPSLEAIPAIERADAWIIDGDHNYYTVLHELRAIRAQANWQGRPLLALLHDVGWPCARRDSYYAPDRIPPEWRQPFDYEGGTVPGEPGLLPGGGFRGMGQFAWATREGGARNGVLTAVEDFIAEQADGPTPLAFALVPAVFGLGILFEQGAPYALELAPMLLPFHHNPLIEALERNRLANYLRVIELQDAKAA